MTFQGSVLVAHSGAKMVTREDLKTIPVPEGTKTHQPLSHYEIVEVLEEALSFRHLSVVKDEYAVSADGMKMFGVMDLNNEFSEGRFSIGLRNSNDKSMRLALTAGYRVFVCDNMAFSGDFTPLLHKHTRNLELRDSISIAVDRIHRGFDKLEVQIDSMRGFLLTDNDARLLIYHAFVDGRIKAIPKYLLPLVHENYFEPKQEKFRKRNLWALSNAFTSAFKQLAPIKQFEVTARLGSYLTDVQCDRNLKSDDRKIVMAHQNEHSIRNDEHWPRLIDCGTDLASFREGAELRDDSQRNVMRSGFDTTTDENFDIETDNDPIGDLVDAMEEESARKAAA